MSDGKRVHQVNHHLFSLHGTQTMPSKTEPCLRCGTNYAMAVSECTLSRKENEVSRDHVAELLAFFDLWEGEMRSPEMLDWTAARENVKAILSALETAKAACAKQAVIVEPPAHRVVLVEKLAALAHERWAKWTGWMHDGLLIHGDGADDDWYTRWHHRYETSYERLPEQEKEGARKEARKILAILEKSSDGEIERRSSTEKHVVFEMNGHRWEFVGGGEPHDVEHCVYCNESYASGSFPGSERQCPGKRVEHPMCPVVVQEVPVKRSDGRPASRIEVTFPEMQNTVTIKEAKHAAREVLEKAEEAREPETREEIELRAHLQERVCEKCSVLVELRSLDCAAEPKATRQEETFDQKVARVEQAAAELKAYQATVEEKLVEVMKFADELRKEHEGKK